MSFTNSTTNYHLPQYINTDIPSYLVDQNQAWATIDTNLKSVSNVADGAATTAGSAQSAASSAQSTANSASTKADGALSNEADAYSTTDTYTVGDYVIYNSILYKCVTAVTVPEAFDSDKWTRDTIENMIDAANSDIDTINNTITGIQGNITDIEGDLSVKTISGLPVTPQTTVTVDLTNVTYREIDLTIRIGSSTWTFPMHLTKGQISHGGTFRTGQSFYYPAGQITYSASIFVGITNEVLSISGELFAGTTLNNDTVLVFAEYK